MAKSTAKSKRKLGQDEVSDVGTTSGSTTGVNEAGGEAGVVPVVKESLTATEDSSVAQSANQIALRRAVMDVAVSAIHGSEDNIRTSLGDLTELAASIKAVGVLQPLLVETREYDQDTITKLRKPGYRVVCGHRRLAAAKLAGIASVPVIVATFESNQQRMLVMLAENIHRENMNPMDEARAFDALRVMGYDAHHVAIRIHRSEAYVQRRVRLLQLHPTFQKMVGDGVLPLEQAFVLARLGHDVQEKVFNDAFTKVMGPGYTYQHLDNESKWPDEDSDDVKTPWPWTLAELREVLDGFAVVDMDWAIWRLPAGVDPASHSGGVRLYYEKTDTKSSFELVSDCVDCPRRVREQEDLFGGPAMDRCLRPECYRAKELKYAVQVLQQMVDAGRKPVVLINGDGGGGYRLDDLRAAFPGVQFKKMGEFENTGLAVLASELPKAKHKNRLIGMVWWNNPAKNYANSLRRRVNCELMEYVVIKPEPKATPEKAEPKASAPVVEADQDDDKLTTQEQAKRFLAKDDGSISACMQWLSTLPNYDFAMVGLDPLLITSKASDVKYKLAELRTALHDLAQDGTNVEPDPDYQSADQVKARMRKRKAAEAGQVVSDDPDDDMTLQELVERDGSKLVKGPKV